MDRKEDQRELLERAAAAVKELRGRLNAQQQKSSEPIAIVGLGCRFPAGADSPDAFWNLLERGVDAVSEIPPSRFAIGQYYDPNPDAPGKISIRRAAFLDQIDTFDAEFFGISSREAVQMDPQQRLSLEVAWEALEDAGQTLDRLSRTPTGVFLGAISTDYVWRQWDDVDSIDAYSGTGTHSSLISGRLSWFLDLRGPSLTLDSACSSSLVAIHLACQSLRLGDCNLALAGGVNLVTSPASLMAYSRMGLLAPDGLCKTFDSRADGFVPGEGCGIAVLKRLSDALADRDNIRAVIRGSAVNQDGRSSTLTAPNGPAQADVISRALANAGVSADRVSYIEAHGTGTALGDPIELEALRSVMDVGAGAARCAVGSVKTNIGHLGPAAGIAGLIKVVLSLQHKSIPGHLHFRHLNPHVSLDGSRLFVPVDQVAWTGSPGPLTAGVSSFGWSGTNAHVILEQAPAAPAELAERGGSNADTYFLPLSARSPDALAALTSAYADTLSRAEFADPAQLRALCDTAATRRTHHKNRLAATGESARDLIERLSDIDRHKPRDGLLDRGVAFVFCGQGAQWPGAGQDLYRREAAFRVSLDETDAAVRRIAGWSILEKMARSANPEELESTMFAQPAIFALQVAMSRQWQSWGIEPSVVVGHSVGEIAAAHISKALSLEDAVKVVVNRANRMQAATGRGAMAEVELTPEEAREFIGELPNLAIAAYNSPCSVVVAGAPADVNALIQSLGSRGIRCTALRPAYAFHSPQMDPYVEPLIRDLHGLKREPASVPFYSTVHGGAGSDGDFTARYWGRNLRQPVLFSQAIGRMIDEGCRMFLEVGAHPVLSPAISASLARKNVHGAVLPSLHRKRSERGCMLESLGALFSAGANVKFKTVAGGASHYRPLPLYPWQRKRYWLDVAKTPPAPTVQPVEIGWYDIGWERVQANESALHLAVCRRNWLLFEDRPAGLSQSLSSALKERVEAAGALCVSSLPGGNRAEYDGLLDAAFTGTHAVSNAEWNVVFVCPPLSAPESVATLTGNALLLAQACLDSASQIKLWIVTRGAQPPNVDSGPTGVAHAPLIGLGRTLAVESPHVWGGSIDVAPGTTDHSDSILRWITSDSSDKEFAIRASGTYVPRLSQSSLPPRGTRLVVRSDKSYLIAGGLGGVGIAVARSLVGAGAGHLMLLGRGKPSPAAAVFVEEMESLGVTCTVHRGDVAVRADSIEAVSAFGATLPELAGVVHSAGVVHDAAIPSIAPDELPPLLAAKTIGAWNLHEAVGERPLDFFVMFSSVSSVLGSAGQGSYSAANAFLDRLAYHRQVLGLRALTINWGPWAETGMAARMGDAIRSRWAHQGIRAFSAAQGAEMFMQLAGSHVAQRCVAIVDWRQFRHSRAQASPISGNLAGTVAGEETVVPDVATEDARTQFGGLAVRERRGWLSAWMRRAVAKILKAEERGISPGRNLLELGFDSLMVMELLRVIYQAFQIRTYPREFHQYPSIDAFAAYLSDEMTPGLVESPSGSPAVLPSNKSAVASRPVRRSARLEDPVVFLLSAPRSGSTLLRVMLAGHPGLFCPPELHLLGFSTMRDRRAALRESYLQEGLLRAIQELNSASAEEAKAFEEEWVSADLTVQAVYARLQEMANGRLLVDKSPPYAASPWALKNAEELFASARYIHLIRHPLSMIDSFVNNRFDRLLGLNGTSPRDAAETIWVESNANVSDFFQSIDRSRTTTIRYEDLVRTPARVMRDLCSFLAIPFDDAVLKPYEGGRMTDGLQTQSVGIGDPGFLSHTEIDASLADAWRSAKRVGSLGPKARSIAAKFNYEMPSSPLPSARMTEQPVEVRGLSLCLCSWGPADGHPVFILHGALDHGAAWEEVAMSLAGRGFRVLAPDQRGHGLSQHVGPEGSYYLMDFLADADTLLRQVALAPVTLVGHSMGASLAAMLTAARPGAVSRLVLVESMLAPHRAHRNSSEVLSAHLNGIEWEMKPQTFPDANVAAQRLREFYPAMAAPQAMKMAARLLEPCSDGLRWRWDERIRSLAGIAYHGTFDLEAPRFLSILSEIQVPVTLVRGTESEIVSSEQTATQLEVLREGRGETLGGGHNLHVDCPIELAGVISTEEPAVFRGPARKSHVR
jgi:acyl transferase domain-containing protein/pimeloyl-ACP methyl ester carboxylesterase/aryl carrier-like protein